MNWFAEHSLAIVIFAAIVAIAIKFERWLPHYIKWTLFGVDVALIIVGVAVFYLKDRVDIQWKTKIEHRVDNVENASNEVKDAINNPAIVLPFKDRLRKFLDSVDPKILQALARNNTQFSGHLKQYQFDELEKLCSEKEAFLYITVSPQHRVIYDNGVYYSTDFDLDPQLLE